MTENHKMSSSLCLAFVTDKETENVLREVYLAHLELKLEIRQGDLKEATHYLQTHRSPRILILDISTSTLPLSDMYVLGEACEPGVEVIVLGVKNDVGLFRQLINIGVRDYIVKPITNMLVQKSIELIVSDQQAEQPENSGENAPKAFSSIGRSVAFIGVRGGVGSTTLAANCAWYFANTFSKRTSLVDFDAQQGMIAPLFDIDTARGFKETVEAPDRIDEIFSERVMVKQSERLYVLSAAESLVEPVRAGNRVVELLSRYLLANFQYSIFDLPRHYMEPYTLQFLRQADTVVIVTDFNILSVRDTFRILKYLKEDQSPLQRIFIIANKVKAYKEGELVQNEFEDAIQNKVHLTIKFDELTPLVALNQGLPIASLEGALEKGIYALSCLLLDSEHESVDRKEESFFDRFLPWKKAGAPTDKVKE